MADQKPNLDSWLDDPQDTPFPAIKDVDAWLDEPAAEAQPQQLDVDAFLDAPEETWGETMRKAGASIVPAFKQSLAGLSQRAAETSPSPLSMMMGPLPLTGQPGGPTMGDVTGMLQKQATDWLREKLGLGPDTRAEEAAQAYAEAQAEIEANATSADPLSAKGLAHAGTVSLAQMMPAIIAGVATKNPSLAVGIMGGQVAGQKYGESRAEWRGPGQAAADSNFFAAAEAIPEMTPIGIILKPGYKIGERLFKAGVSEGFSEFLTAIMQTGYDAGVLKDDMTWGEAITQIQQATLLGMGTGPIVAAAAHPFVADRGAESTPPNGAAGVPSTDPGTLPPAIPPSQPDPAASTTPPSGPWSSPPPMEKDAVVGLKMGDRPPVRATIESIQDGWVFWRDENGDVQTDREEEFRRDLTTPPPARRGDRGAATEPSGPPTPPPVETGDINDFDPFAIQEPKPPKPTADSPQRSMAIPDMDRVKDLKASARYLMETAAQAQRILESGSENARTPEAIALMRVEAARALDEAAALEAKTNAPDPTAATPEQMAARGMGALSGAAPAASEATTGPQAFEVTPPKAPPAPAQAALEPVARSEATEGPVTFPEKPKPAPVPWQRELANRIRQRKAKISDLDKLATQLGVTPQEVNKELGLIASGKDSPIRQVRGRLVMDKKTKQVTQSKRAGTWQYKPRPNPDAIEDLADFVRNMGGIRPGMFEGEMLARDMDKIKTPVGKSKIMNPNARMSLEDMAMAAMENGFMVPTEAGSLYDGRMDPRDPVGRAGSTVGTTSPNIDRFLDMLDQNAHGTRRHFRLGEEPIVETGKTEDEVAAERKAAVLDRLKELGFEPKGTTVAELAEQLESYENAIEDFVPDDITDTDELMWQETTDRMGDEARAAFQEQARDDFPTELTTEQVREQIRRPKAAADNAPAGGAQARDGEAAAEPDREGGTAAGAQDRDAASQDAEQQAARGTETSRVSDDEFGSEDSTDDRTADLKAHIAKGGTPHSWVFENGQRTGNEFAAVIFNGQPLWGYTSNNPSAVSWYAPTDMALPGANVAVTHNHPTTDGVSSAALSNADLQPLAQPGFTFITANTASGDVASAALTDAAGDWLFALSLDEAVEALTRMYAQAHRGAMNMSGLGHLESADLAMRILAHAGLVEYHTTIPRADSMLQSQIDFAAAALKKRMVENGFETPDQAYQDDNYRPTEHLSVDGILAAIQRRAAKIAAGRAGKFAPRVGKAGAGSEESRQGTSRVSGRRDAEAAGQPSLLDQTEADLTSEGLQPVLIPGTRSAEQAAKARADAAQLEADQKRAQAKAAVSIKARAPLTSKKAQLEPGGMFGDGAQPLGQESLLTRLMKDEKGTLDVEAWKKIREFFSSSKKSPQTAKGIAAQANKIPLGNPNTLRSLTYAASKIRSAVSLASIDRISANYFNAILQQDHVKTTLEREGTKAVQPYLALDVKARDRINKVLEYDRLFGIDRGNTGRTVVVKVPDKRPPFGERPELSRPGEIIALDRAETDALNGLRKFFDKRLLQIGEAAAIERGYTGPFNKAAIQRAIDSAGSPFERNPAKAAMEIFEQTEDMRRTGYVPFGRHGDTYILVKPIANEGNETAWFELVDTKSAFDKVFSRAGGKNRKVFDERMAALKARFPADKFEITYGAVSPTAISQLNIPALEKALASVNLKGDKEGKKIVDQLMTQIFQARKAGLRKQSNNVPGYSTDFERSVVDYVMSSSSIAAHLANRKAVDTAYEATQRHPVPEVRQYWENHLHHMEKEGGDLANIRKFGFYMFLWGNPASAAVNLTQTPLVTMMQLGTWAGPRAPGLAHGAMMTALSSVTVGKNGMEINWDDLAKKISPAEMAMIRTLQAEGRLDPVIADEMAGFDKGREKARPHLKALMQAHTIGASMFNTTETVNRIAAALSYFRAAQNEQLRQNAAKVYKDDQMWQAMVGRIPQPIDIARFGVDETQFIGGKINRAPAMRGIGAVAFQFKTYIANYLRLIHKNATRMGPQGKLAAAAMLMALLMISGLAGLPFLEDVLSAADWAYSLGTGIDHNLEYQFRNWLDDAGFGEYWAEVATRGFGRNVFGVDIGGRLGMGNLAPDNSFASLAPVLTGTIGNLADASRRYASGQTHGAVAQAAPMFVGSGVANIYKALVAYPEEGVRTKKGNPILWPEEITVADQATKMLGFQPSRITRKSEAEYQAGRIENATKDARTSMLTDLTWNVVMADKARAKGDAEAAAKYDARIDEIFADNVAQLLDPDIPDWQKIKPPSRVGIKRRFLSMIAPDVARMKRSSKMSREELSDLPFVEE